MSKERINDKEELRKEKRRANCCTRNNKEIVFLKLLALSFVAFQCLLCSKLCDAEVVRGGRDAALSVDIVGVPRLGRLGRT